MNDSSNARPRLNADGTYMAPAAPTPPPVAAPAPMQYQQAQAIHQPGGFPPSVGIASVGLRLGCWILESILAVVTLGIGWLIWAAITSGKGQTPAKQLLKIRVIDATTGRPVGFGRMFFMRGIVAGIVAGFAISFTFGILLFMPIWDKRNQNLWDKVSGTLVVTDPNNAWHLA